MRGPVVVDESSVEVGESEEGLDCLDVMRLGPGSDDLGFGLVHRNPRGRDDEAEVFDGVGVEGGFREVGVEVVFSEAL